jgi:hypothetical protein
MAFTICLNHRKMQSVFYIFLRFFNKTFTFHRHDLLSNLVGKQLTETRVVNCRVLVKLPDGSILLAGCCPVKPLN